MPVYPNQTTFESCLAAVKHCDLFLGIITPYYGSGVVDKNGLSITHKELLKAIELNKPRWILSHDHVPFARTLLQSLGYNSKKKWANAPLKKNSVLDNLRVIDMYEAAIRHDMRIYQDRKGNWVQKFGSNQDAALFVTAQFSHYADVKRFLTEQFENSHAVRQQTARRSGQ